MKTRNALFVFILLSLCAGCANTGANQQTEYTDFPAFTGHGMPTSIMAYADPNNPFASYK